MFERDICESLAHTACSIGIEDNLNILTCRSKTEAFALRSVIGTNYFGKFNPISKISDFCM